MEKYLILSCMSLFSLFACTQTEKKSDPRFKGIETVIDSLIQEHHAAGLAVAVVEKGETIYSKGFGYRDFENKKPVDENTVFGIGSCSKAFTAAVLGVLEGEDKLSLSDNPNKYLTDLNFSSDGMNDSITIKHCLAHTTGLGATSSECTAVLFISSDKYDVIPRIQHLKPATAVGKEFIYNNLMYSVAGMVSEKASGKSLEENWQEMIFNPVGMSNTYVDVEQATKNLNFSYGYAVDSITPYRVLAEDMSVRGAGGGIYSTVSDMSKWMEVWMNEGRYKGKQVLPKSYVIAAQDTIIKLPNNPIDSIPVTRHYGFGWGNWNHKGFKRSEHSGGTSGYVSNVVMYPDEGVGIVVLSNQTTTSLPSRVNNLIVECMYPQLKERPLDVRFGPVFNIAPMDSPSIPDTILPPSYSLSNAVGKYSHPGFGELEVSLKDKTLYADFPLTKFRLQYVGNNVFYDYFTEEIPYVYWNFLEFRFNQDERGKIDGVWINVDDEPVLFSRKTRR